MSESLKYWDDNTKSRIDLFYPLLSLNHSSREHYMYSSQHETLFKSVSQVEQRPSVLQPERPKGISRETYNCVITSSMMLSAFFESGLFVINLEHEKHFICLYT